MAVIVSAQTDPLAKGLRGAGNMVDQFSRDAARTPIIDFQKSIAGARDLRNSIRDVRAEVSRTQSVFGKVAKYGVAGALTGGVAVGAKFGFDTISSLTGGLTDIVTDSVKMAAAVETTTSSFEVLLGSVEKARDLMGELREYAANSPLTFDVAAAGAKNLASFGIAQDQLIPTLRAIGDIAAGDNDKFGRLITNYGQVAAAGRLTGSELRDFTQNGVPLLDALSKALNKPKESIKSLAEQGKIGFDDTVKAFKVLTEEGGLFFGRGEKYSRTFAGSLDRVQDSVEQLKTAFGQALVDELGLQDAAGDIERFTDKLRMGIREIRPWIRAIGELGRGVIQVGYEFGKAGIELGRGWLDHLAGQIPELRNVVNLITQIGKDGQGFRIDPEKARELGAAFAQATEGIFTNILEAGRNFKTEVVDPIVAAAREIKGVADYLREFGRTASDVKKVITGAPTPIAGKDVLTEADKKRLEAFEGPRLTRFGFGPGNEILNFDRTRGNATLAGPIERKTPIALAQQEEEARLRKATNDLRKAQDILDHPDWKKAEVLRNAAIDRDRAKGEIAATQRRLGDIAKQAELAAKVREMNKEFNDALAAKPNQFAGILGTNPDGTTPQVGERPGAGVIVTNGEIAPPPRLAGVPIVDQSGSPAKNRPLEVPKQIPPDVRAAAEQANKLFRDPLEAFRESEANLNRARQEGLITDDIFARAFGDKLRELAQSGAIDREFRLPSAMEMGSQSAAAAITAQQGARDVPSLLQQLIETNQQELEVARDQLRQYEAAKNPIVVPLSR